MRTTLAIDDDVLATARAIARQSGRTVGEVVSSLARSALHPASQGQTRNGIPLLAVRAPGTVVTTDIVNALRDDGP